MLPALQADMGELCQVEVLHTHQPAATPAPPGAQQQPQPPQPPQAAAGMEETVMRVHKCKYHEILTQVRARTWGKRFRAALTRATGGRAAAAGRRGARHIMRAWQLLW